MRVCRSDNSRPRADNLGLSAAVTCSPLRLLLSTRHEPWGTRKLKPYRMLLLRALLLVYVIFRVFHPPTHPPDTDSLGC